MTALDWHTLSVITWLHLRCSITDTLDSSYHVTVIYIAYHSRISEFADRDSCWAFSSEVLFHLSICTHFSNCFSVFEHHSHCSRSTLRTQFCTDSASYKSSQSEQLLLFLSTVMMLLWKRKFTSSSEMINQLIYLNHEHYTETDMREADKFVSDAVRHYFLNLYQSSLHW